MRVDISGVATGTQLTVNWPRQAGVHPPPHRGRDRQAAREVPLDDLVDQDARNPNIAEGRRRPTKTGRSTSRARTPASGWFRSASARTWAACRSATAQATSAAGSAPATARITTRRAASAKRPAPENLHIPLAEFVDDMTILLG
jgi:ubiquinol-cytochrome c reductase iron-sulfur subunit